jgi:hemerythrin-like domain-containing protein
MKATDELAKEHETILNALEILKCAAKAVKNSESGAVEDAQMLVGFFKTFVDRCHHLKEETALFPKLVGAGMPLSDGPLAVMLDEHERSRTLLRNMEQSLLDQCFDNFEQSADRYYELLSRHIEKENNVLFSMADGYLLLEDDRQIVNRFRDVERLVGEFTHERFERMFRRLEPRYRAMTRTQDQVRERD